MSETDSGQPGATAPEYLAQFEACRHAEVIQDVFTFSDEVIARYHPQLWAVAERAGQTLMDPMQREALKAYMHRIEWQVLGHPSGVLPQGTIYVQNGDSQMIGFDSRIPYLNETLNAYGGQLGRLGLAEVLSSIIEELKPREPLLRETLHDFITRTAEYQLLKSFDDTERPPSDLPLTPFWRHIRERQLEDDVRQRHGLGATALIQTGSHAYRDLRRGMYELDAQTMPRFVLPQGSQDALQRARAYLMPYIAAAYEDRLSREKHSEPVVFGGMYYDEEDGETYVHSQSRDRGDDDELWYVANNAAETLSSELYIGPPELREIAVRFFQSATRNIGDIRAGGTLKDILDETVASSVEEHIRELYDVLRVGLGFHGDGDVPLVRPASGQTLQYRAVELQNMKQLQNGYTWQKVINKEASLETYFEYTRQQAITLGYVDAYSPPDARVASRLLQARPVPRQPVVHHEQPDLVLWAPHFKKNRQVPHIPGYKLVNYERPGEQFEFAVDPEGDPYAECRVPVNRARRRILAKTYRSIGLHELADKVGEARRLTVSELVTLISEQSVYHLPATVKGAYEDSPDRAYIRLRALQDAGDIVRNGKLYVQCTGADAFLRLSLEEIFGPGSSGTISGYTIKGASSIITGLSHRQTVYTHKGHVYILDATPAFHMSSMDTVPGRVSGLGAAPKAYNLGDLPVSDALPEVTAKPEISLEEALATLTTSTVKRLKVALDKPTDEALYSHLAALPRHDPARKTVELLLQSTKAVVTQEMMEEADRYLRRCIASLPEVRRRYGFEGYSNSLLEQLSYACMKLQTLLKQPDA